MAVEATIIAISVAIIYSLTTFLCAIYHYARFKRWKHGKRTNAKVLDHWTEYESSDDGTYGNATHYIKFSFVDDQTDQYLAILVAKYMTIDEYQTLPLELIKLICKFIVYDNSVIFFTGPYQVTRKATIDVMGLSEQVNIVYDINNPYNVDFQQIQNDGFCSKILLCLWIIVTAYVGLQLHWIMLGWVTLAMMVLSGMFAGLSIIGIPYFAISICKRNKLYACTKQRQPQIELLNQNLTSWSFSKVIFYFQKLLTSKR